MELSQLLEPSRCIVGVRYADKSACLGNLAKRAAAELGIDHARVVEALAHRESLGSTGLGHGIALPHARVAGLKAPFALVALLRDAILFEAVDGEPVDIVCIVLLPMADGCETKGALACVARCLRNAATLAAIRRSKSAEALHCAMTA